jgi:hypothetical protein
VVALRVGVGVAVAVVVAVGVAVGVGVVGAVGVGVAVVVVVAVAVAWRREMSPAAFGALVGVDARTALRWESGATVPTGAAERVLAALVVALREDADGRIVEILRSAASVGGLSYLLIYLLRSPK